ncbi:ABC transporter substrate-binding protein [Ectothiorhodospiraceae bacterium BW-2]|nr:ABC transporter substrate-binding protein [Ectothiorhodospiraceae bacterium BW-2]
MKPLLKPYWLLLLLFSTATVLATPPPPSQLLSEATEKLIETLTEQQQQIKTKPELLLTIADTHLLPLFDVKLMSRYVLGPSWNSASPEQQQLFEQEFTNLIMRFYISALMSDPQRIDQLVEAGSQIITYHPVTNLNDKSRKVVVKATVTLPGEGQQLPVDFRLYRRSSTDGWRIYDLTVEGISLITNYRNTFSIEISRDGLAPMLKRLQQKNADILQQIRQSGTLKEPAA